MNKLMMKAKAGVTLVELLVVILIVTILSVSMLPLLQPFVTEAQYAAEPIPVVGNLRTKIGLYHYDKGLLPCAAVASVTNSVQTWIKDDGTDKNLYNVAFYNPSGEETFEASETNSVLNHISTKLDINFEDLTGKRSRPSHYQYLVISPKERPSYVVGCFGDGDGLKAGTGYAVCELKYKDKKFIGTWKRYKAKDEESAIKFTTNAGETRVNFCYVPDETTFLSDDGTPEDNGFPSSVNLMIQSGWEF